MDRLDEFHRLLALKRKGRPSAPHRLKAQTSETEQLSHSFQVLLWKRRAAYYKPSPNMCIVRLNVEVTKADSAFWASVRTARAQCKAQNLTVVYEQIQAASLHYIIPKASQQLFLGTIQDEAPDSGLSGWTESQCRAFDSQVKKDLAEVSAALAALKFSIEARKAAAEAALSVRKGLKEREQRAKVGLAANIQHGLESAKEWLKGLSGSQPKRKDDSALGKRPDNTKSQDNEHVEEELDETYEGFTTTALHHYERVLESIDTYITQCNAKMIGLRQSRQENSKKYMQDAKPKVRSTSLKAPTKLEGHLATPRAVPVPASSSNHEKLLASLTGHNAKDEVQLDRMQGTKTMNDESDSQEMTQLQLEARQWKATLETDLDAAHETEQRMEAIAQLMQLFSIKVQEQSECMLSIQDNTVQVSANVISANDEIAQAIARGGRASFYLILFFILAAFSLLFLDWMS